MTTYYMNNYDTTAHRDITTVIAVSTRAEKAAMKDFVNRWKNSADPVWDLRRIPKSTAKCGIYTVKTAAEFFGC